MSQKTKKQTSSNKDGERIAKRMARAGLCSRREAERWIEAGRVSVNGETLKTAACVVTDQDTILVDGKPLGKSEKTRLFLYHKPAGLVTSNKDELGRPTIFDKFPGELPRVVTVGRLDLNTEGLLLLTNDGELSRYLELPATGITRTYRVRVLGKLTESNIKRLKDGMTVEGVKYGSIIAQPDPDNPGGKGKNNWIIVSLEEGKKREIRIVLDALGLPVNRLIRISYGPFDLGNLARGAITEIPYKILTSKLPKFFK